MDSRDLYRLRTVLFAELQGVTLGGVEGLEEGSTWVEFIADDGRRWAMAHEPDCCESVSVVDVTGDVADIIGHPILLAEESGRAATEEEAPEESGTWTFYKINTVRGDVTIRWLGTSNGYYSEAVGLYSVPAGLGSK